MLRGVASRVEIIESAQNIVFLPLRLQSDSFVSFLLSKGGIYAVSRSPRMNMLFAPL